MRLLEFQAKRILTEFGIPVPHGVLLLSEEDLTKVSFPAVFKAQVPVGGRGKAGAIRVVNDPEAGADAMRALLGVSVKGYPVQALLAEDPAVIQREMYLAYLIDKQANLPLLMASRAGGVDIEETAREAPDQVIRKHIDPALGLQDFALRSLAKSLGWIDFSRFRDLVHAMTRVFHERDASLVEINPLAITPDGPVALDAKIVLDDKAAYRHGDLFASLQAEQRRLDKRAKSQSERLAEAMGIGYVPLDGDIGMIADGAGTGMLTMDLIHAFGGRAANFCEMGGISNAETMERAIRVVAADPRVKVILIGLIGGMTRMDEMADGIVAHVRGSQGSVPLVIRMCGTRADVGRVRLGEIGIEPYDDLSNAVRDAVARAGRS
jgi:succinyl-CoA synthetase beta subunit